jgi:hypothetical protein
VSILLMPPPLLLLMTLIFMAGKRFLTQEIAFKSSAINLFPNLQSAARRSEVKRGKKATQRGKEGKMWHLISHY